MDWISLRSRCVDAVKQYRYVVLVILVGLFLMVLPESKGETKSEIPCVETEIQSLQDSLAHILSQIQGAGKVQVLLTEAGGAETHYQFNEDIANTAESGDIRRDTVLVTNADREENGLIRKIDPPIYQGAIVVCQGADSAAVRLAIVDAVANATGLSSDHISVLKMK